MAKSIDQRLHELYKQQEWSNEVLADLMWSFLASSDLEQQFLEYLEDVAEEENGV